MKRHWPGPCRWTNRDFIGRDVLEAQKAAAARQMIGLVMDERACCATARR